MEPSTQSSAAAAAARPSFQGGIGSAAVKSTPAPALTKTTAAPAAKPTPTAPAAAAKTAAKVVPVKVKAKPISKAVREAEGLVKAAQAVLTAAREHQLSEERLAKAKENYKNLAKG